MDEGSIGVPHEATPQAPKDSSHLAAEIKTRIKPAGAVYKAPLADLVSTIVAANPQQDEALKGAIKKDFDVEEMLFDARRSEDWEKALHDEANFQFSSTHRPVVEAVLNGIDTQLRKDAKNGSNSPRNVDVQVNNKGFIIRDHGEGMDLDTVLTKLLVPKLTGNQVATTDVVGRFGVGFYSLLGYLKNERDHVIVRTTNGTEGYRVSISKFGHEHDQQRLSVEIAPLGELEQANLKQGTEVEVRTHDFTPQDTEKYLTDTLQYKTGADIVVNGHTINDTTDMDVHTIALRRNYGEKEREARILESKERSNKSTIVLAVGGVKVEEFSAGGTDLPEHFVFDIPPGDNLPKSRDKVGIGQDTITTVKRTIDTILSGNDVTESARLVSAFSPLVLALQKRNPYAQRTMNMDLALVEGVKKWSGELPPDKFLIPSCPDLTKVDMPNAVPIDDRFITGTVEIPGKQSEAQFHSGKLYWVPFKQHDSVIAVVPGMVLANEAHHTSDPRKLGVINALVETHNKAALRKDPKIAGKFVVGHVPHRRIASTAETALPKDTRQDNQEAYTVADFADSLIPKIEGTPLKYDKYYQEHWRNVPVSVPDYTERVDREVERRLEERSGIDKLRDKLDPSRIEAIRQEVMATMPARQEARVDIPVEYVTEVDYTPESAEQLQSWILHTVTAEAIKKQFRWRDPRVQIEGDIVFSHDPEFWRSIVDDSYFATLDDFISPDLEHIERLAIAGIPDHLRTQLSEEFIQFYATPASRTKPLERSHFDFLLSPIRRYASSTQCSQEDKVQLARLTLATETALMMHEIADVYNDGQLLADLSKGGRYSEFMNKALTTRWPFTFSQEKIANFIQYQGSGDERVVLPPTMRALSRLNSHEVRVGYMEWAVTYQGRIDRIKDTLSKYSSLSRFGEDQYDNFYTVCGNDEHKWQTLEANAALFERMYESKSSMGIRHSDAQMEIPPIEYLQAGILDWNNVQAIYEQRDSGTIDTRQQNPMFYVREAFGYAHLPPELFTKVNPLLVRMYTERDPLITQMDDDLRQGNGGWRNRFWEGGGFGSFQFVVDTPEMIERKVALLENLPAEYAIAFYKFKDRLVQPQWGLQPEQYRELATDIESKLITVFDKLSQMPSQEAITLMLKLHDELSYGRKALIQKLDSFENVDRDVRPWIMYLVGDAQKLPHMEKGNFMEGMTATIQISGSDLVGRYFTSDDLASVQEFSNLQQIIATPLNRSRAQAVGQRRIEHAANYQNTQGYAWLRELVQNAYNATRTTEEKAVDIESFIEGSDFAISVSDPAGMSVNRVVNALLVPQKSDWESKESLGYFGHGFFTVFKEADEVRVKTSLGNGQSTYVQIVPKRENGKVMDLDIHIGQKDEAYKGTSVTWVKKTDVQDFEASRARAELTTYAGLVPAGKLQIHWNGELANKHATELAKTESSMGDVAMYHVAGENTLTQNGLFVKDLDVDITGMMPTDMRRILLGHGITVDIPGSVQLIDSRADIAHKELVLPQLQDAFTEGSIRASVQLFTQGKVQFDHLPYDFFERALQYSNSMDPKVWEDVEALQEKRQIDWADYRQHPVKGLQLVLAIPCMEIDGEPYSIISAVARATGDPEFRAKLPFALSERVEARPTPQQQAEMKDRFESSGYKVVPEFDPQELPQEFDSYAAWGDLFNQFIDPARQQQGARFKNALYSSPENSIARFMPLFQTIGWNLPHFGGHVETLSRVIRGEQVAPQEILQLYEFMGEVGSHEYEHAVENRSEDWTHNTSFYIGQRRILEEIIRANGNLTQAEGELKTRYSGGYASPAEVSVLAAQTRS